MPNYNFVQLVNDPTFAQNFTIQRDSGGVWSKGAWVPRRTTVAMYGIIQPATEEELEIVPAGDRVSAGAVIFHSSKQMYETNTNQSGNTQQISDIVQWNGQSYKLVRVWPWQDFGYYRALGVRMAGE